MTGSRPFRPPVAWGPGCGPTRVLRPSRVDNLSLPTQPEGVVHRQAAGFHPSSTLTRDGETGSDLREHRFSTVSTAPTNTMGLDRYPSSVNFTAHPDLGTNPELGITKVSDFTPAAPTTAILMAGFTSADPTAGGEQ